jgi:hypothetical protein
MIVIGVFATVVFLTLVYEFKKERNARSRLAILVAQTILASVAFVLAWDIAWIRFVAGTETVIEVCNLVSVVSPEDFKQHLVPLLRLTYIAALLPVAVEREYGPFVLFAITSALCLFEAVESNRSLFQGILPFHVHPHKQ